MDWVASEEDIKNAKDDPVNYQPARIPRIDPRNVIDKDISYKNWANGNPYKLVEKDDKSGIYYNLRRIEYFCVWAQEFSVKNFPFDVQELIFVFQSREFNKTQRREFVPSHLFPNFFRIETTYLSIKAEWKLRDLDAYQQQIDWRRAAYKYRVHKVEKSGQDTEMVKKSKSVSRRIVPRMCFRLQVQRRARPIIMRVIVWMTLLGILTTFQFSIPPYNIGDRLGYDITMVLAIVAFQFVINSIIPNVPYLTIVDRYNLYIFGCCLISTFEAVIVGWRAEEDNINEFWEMIDEWFTFIYIAVFLIGAHILWIIYAIVKYRFEASKIGQSWRVVQGSKFDEEEDNERAEPVSIMTYNRTEFYEDKMEDEEEQTKLMQ